MLIFQKIKFHYVIKTVFFLLFFLFAFNLYSQDTGKSTYIIDSIEIRKNWRTKDQIILRELQFRKGETISQKTLQKSIAQIWNIGNFSEVNYSLDSLTTGSCLLTINAKDAFTLLPILSFSGNHSDYQLGLGFKDKNFLGRNISFKLEGNFGTTRNDYNMNISLPRQLLYKNMTLSFKVSKGTGNNYIYQNNYKVSAVAYHKWNFSGMIGNPFQTDYHYTFSPDISWNLFQHKTDSTLLNGGEVMIADDYKINYLALSVRESVGLINTIRHQKEGFSTSFSIGMGLGLNRNSPLYSSVGFNVACYKLVNRLIELSFRFSSGYTTATSPSLIHYLGPDDIKGLLTGQEAGQGYYAGIVRAGFTYVYRDWFALEHSIFSNFGKAGNRYFNMFRTVPRISLGTSVKIYTPMIPWLGASINFIWMKGNSKWFYLSI